MKKLLTTFTIGALMFVLTPLSICDSTLPFEKRVFPAEQICQSQPSCRLMAFAIYHEARGEGAKGMQAVANVIMKRVDDKRWPSTIEEVIRDKKQFSFWSKKKLDIEERGVYIVALRLANKAVEKNLVDVTKGATHFLSKKDLTRLPRWVYSKQVVRTVRIGRHTFYYEKSKISVDKQVKA
jgi:spore germination cell wall hydrolase CwlJ-like protein